LHLVQFWRLLHAWQAMEKHERHRGVRYATIVKVRTDLNLPTALDLTPVWEAALHGEAAERVFFMRSDWIFWGSRRTMETVVDGYFQTARLLTGAGDKRYWPLNYRWILAAGPEVWEAGKVAWMRYPSRARSRPYGFNGTLMNDKHAFFAHMRRHLPELEAWDERCAFNVSGADYERNGCTNLITRKPEWFPYGRFPELEKSFFYHVLVASRLVPRSVLVVLNHGLAREKTIGPFGTKGLLPSTRAKSAGRCT